MRLYRILLRLYPSSFRAEYGEEMGAIFARRRRDVSGPLAIAALWTETAAEVIGNAAVVHWDILRQDLRYTARTLSRARGFALTAIAIVALGVGANTAAFSVTDFVLFRPLPFPEPDRLVKLWQLTPNYGNQQLSPANYRDLTRLSTSFERVGAYTNSSMNLIGDGEPERLQGAAVSFDLFPTLGVQPVIGRLFTAADDREGAPGTVLLSYRFWQAAYAGDESILGRRLTLDDEPFVVVGVMPRDFQFPTRTSSEFWRPLRLGDGNYEDRTDTFLYGMGRLKPGVALEQARAEMQVIAAQLERQYPKDNDHIGATVTDLRAELSRQSRMLLFALSGAASCVLLIACANLANLLLARALGRRQELAVRTAMGAGRERLVRQLATESLTLAILGGLLGVGVAVVAVPLLGQLVPQALPMAEMPSVDLRVLGIAALLTALTGIAFGMVPVMRAGGEGSLGGLREGARAGGGRKERLRSALVVFEVVASVVLLVASGLLIRALWKVQATDPGFRAEGVVSLRTALPLPKYESTAKRAEFYTRVLTDVRALPGVTSAAYISFLPMVMRGGIWPVTIPGRAQKATDDDNVSLRFLTPGFFATLGIPVHAGRDIRDSDTADAEFVAVVSESLARRYWPGQSVLGRHFSVAFHDRAIVGVVGDIRVRGLERESEPQVYLSYKQVPDGSIINYTPKDLVVKSSTPPEHLVPAIRGIIRRTDAQQPISDVRTLNAVVEMETASRTVQVRILGAFAAIAFLLAAVGIHGLLSFSVSQRTAEIGVRIALGAQRGNILAMVLRQGAWLAAAGVVPGVVLAYAAGRMMESLLAGVQPGDAATYLAAAGLCLVMTIGGSLVPTVRALRIDPVRAIRGSD